MPTLPGGIKSLPPCLAGRQGLERCGAVWGFEVTERVITIHYDLSAAQDTLHEQGAQYGFLVTAFISE